MGPVSFSLVLATPGGGTWVGASRLKVAGGPGGGVGAGEGAGEEEELVRWGSLQMAKRGKLGWVASASSVRQQRGGKLDYDGLLGHRRGPPPFM